MTLELIAESLKLTSLAGIAIAVILVILIWKKNRTTKVTYLKFAIQGISFVAIFYLFTYTVRPLLLTAIILTIPLILGRFFCGWICPFGYTWMYLP